MEEALNFWKNTSFRPKFCWQELTETLEIFPACLPLKQRSSGLGYHSGWSDPVPYHILLKYAPGLTKVFRDFFKQVHYRMDVLEKCEDANKLALIGEDVEFPTNTYYPPGKWSNSISYKDASEWQLFWLLGTVCSRNLFLQSCFYSGESGSPLMTK